MSPKSSLLNLRLLLKKLDASCKEEKRYRAAINELLHKTRDNRLSRVRDSLLFSNATLEQAARRDRINRTALLKLITHVQGKPSNNVFVKLESPCKYIFFVKFHF